MSLVDIWVHDHRVVAMTDSEAADVTPNGVIKREVSKICAVSHLPAILAARGWTPLVSAIMQMASYVTLTTDLINDMARGFYVASVLPSDPQFDRNEIFLAGMDRAAGRMRLRAWSQEEREKGFIEEEEATSYLGPWDDAWTQPPAEPAGPEEFADLAKHQCRLLRKLGGPSAAAGGKIILTEVFPDGIVMRHLVDLWPKVGDRAAR